jgi:hypothetical protein
MFNNAASTEDLKGPLLGLGLEFGRELEFFRPKSAAPNPGPSLLGKRTMAYTIKVEHFQLILFTSGEPEVPVALVRKDDKTHEIFWYGEYKQVPFDAKLFAVPEGVKIAEVKP